MNCSKCNQWLPDIEDLNEPGQNGILARLYYVLSATDDNKLICCRCGHKNILPDPDPDPPTYERIIAAVTDGKSYISVYDIRLKRRK